MQQEMSAFARKRTSKELYSDVLAESARLFKVPPELLSTQRRAKPLVQARFAICKAMRMHDVPLKRIGTLMGRHHTSVMYSVEQADILMGENPKFAEKVTELANLDNRPRPKIEKQQHYDTELDGLDNFERRTYTATVKTIRALDTIEAEIGAIKGARPHFVLASSNSVVFTGTARMAAFVARLPNVTHVELDGFTFD